MSKYMTIKKFAPKDAETLKTEITADLNIDYEGNEAMVDKLVERELKSEEFKASLHDDKVKHLKAKEFYKNNLAKAGIDPKTGEKIKSKDGDKTPKNETLSLKNIRALNKVHDDDVDFVTNWAKANNIELNEALKDEDLVAVLSAREEKRQTAQAANTGGGRRGTTEPSDEKIIQEFEQGKVSEDDKDIKHLAEARLNQRLKKAT
jgi:hypothetical protein